MFPAAELIERMLARFQFLRRDDLVKPKLDLPNAQFLDWPIESGRGREYVNCRPGIERGIPG